MRYLVRDMLHKKRFELEEFITIDPINSARIVKLTMVLKALTFNRKVLEDNFNPYIIETVEVTMQIVRKILEEIPPDSNQVGYTTYSNLLSALTFDIHPSNKHDIIYSEFLKLDQTVYQLILENIFVQLTQES